MKKITLTSTLYEYASRSELERADAELLERADAAGKKAYAPYSAFHVGAALRLQNGTILTGNNQENVAYPSGLCAERVAIFHANAQHPEQAVISIAVTCASEKFTVDRPLSPCGACRQVLAETERRYGQSIRIILAGPTGPVYVAESIRELLPLSFEADELKAK
jgi:cytidine deaminase